jgi:uncharacterized membrane protein YfcA
MGGGALTTPILVGIFGIPPFVAVSSDVVAAALIKPFGSFVHARRGTVHWRVVLWLSVGSVPAAFLGVFLLRHFGGSLDQINRFVKTAMGVALLIAATALVYRAYARLIEVTRPPTHPAARYHDDVTPAPRVVLTVGLGAVGGIMVGMTSVGAGSVMLIALMLIYPGLTANRLVGTDLAQSVPLVLGASISNLLFGAVDWGVTFAVAGGSIPGVLIGATLSSRLNGRMVRRALAVMLLASGLTALKVPTGWIIAAILLAAAGGTAVWVFTLRKSGRPGRTVWGRERREDSERKA